MNAHHPSPASQRIWLTGASSGIGLALAEELLAAGHRLALSARRSGPLQQLSELTLLLGVLALCRFV